MNEEEKTITANEPAAEKQTKPTKPKRTDEEKLQDTGQDKGTPQQQNRV